MPDSAPSTSSSPRIPALSDLTLSSPAQSPSISTYTSFLDPLHPSPSTSTHPSSSTTATLDPSHPDFEYGQAVFERRRAAWKELKAPPRPEPAEVPGGDGGGGGSMQRLEDLLSGPKGSDVGEEAWRSGLEGVHRGLLGGRRLVKRMKLGLVIKVLRAGWIRDGTWPASLPPVPPSPPYIPSDLPSTTTEDSTGLTSTPYHPFPITSSSATPTNHTDTLPRPISPPSSIAIPPPLKSFQSAGSATSTPSQTTTTPGSEGTTPDVEGDLPLSPLTSVAEGEEEEVHKAEAEEEKKKEEEEEGTATEHQMGVAI